MNPVLVIGNKNYSSWSLRPWLLMTVKGITFDEVRIPLYQQASRAALLAASRSGKVPVLRDGEILVWDSLAICEYVAERWPMLRCWPDNTGQRAHARAISAEMHAGFAILRTELPMNCRRTPAPAAVVDTAGLAQQIHRIEGIWGACPGGAVPGEFLFGEFGIADAMFAPVVLRLMIYQIPLSEPARTYSQSILALPALQAWLEGARAEREILEKFER
jgi:glutathione S-transferase